MANIAIFLAFLAITAAVVPSIEAADHVVGDASGWIVPASSSFYSEWAAKQTFAVGDNLVFNFVTGAHTVARTTKEGYESCDLNAASSTMSSSPAEMTLNAAGEYYYICTIPGHCAIGQKLAVSVGASSNVPSPTPRASPAPSSPKAASPEPQTAPPTASPLPSEPQTSTPAASPPRSEAPTAMTPEASSAPSMAPSAMTPSVAPSAMTPSEGPSAETPETSSTPSGSTMPTPEASPSPNGSDNPMAEPPASSASSLVATFSIALMSGAAALFY